MKGLVPLLTLIVSLFGPRAGDAVTVQPMGLDRDDHYSIEYVVRAQLMAFREDDVERAFTYVTPGIRERFRSAEAFVRMVRESYPTVYRPGSVEFAEIRLTEHGAVQTVFIVGLDDAAVIAHFLLQRQASGDWRIAGCSLQQSDARAA
ncbi:MAG: DUF4864 domain-containing protein [Rhodospirillales bacterium]|nr:MAG: DUF4864 domain-containing protein [Rhodospirillales bacterium]